MDVGGIWFIETKKEKKQKTKFIKKIKQIYKFTIVRQKITEAFFDFLSDKIISLGYQT